MDVNSYEQNIKAIFAGIWSWFKSQNIWVQIVITGALLALASPWLLILFALLIVVAIFRPAK